MATKKIHRRKKYIRKRRIRIALLVACVITVIFGISYLIISIVQPIKLKETEITIEYKQYFDPMANVRYVFLGDKSEVTTDGTVNTNKKGTYKVRYVYRNKEKYVSIHVKDTQAPALKLKKVTTDTVGSPKKTDFIQTSKDSSAYTTHIKIDNDKKEEGTYKVTVTARDEDGNTTKKTTKMIRKQDTKAPSVSKMGALRIVIGKKFNKKDISVKDNLDPNPMVTVNDKKVKYRKEGKYTIAYTVSDRSGNKQTVKRKVIVSKKDSDKYDKIIYLTFDDGPSKNTDKILKVLKANNVHATFFVTGNNQSQNKYLKKAVRQGNTVALHSYSHKYSIYASKKTYLEDLQKIQDMVLDETGIKSYIVRFPGGSSNTISEDYNKGIMSKLSKELEKRGFEYYDWNLDSTDASGNNVLSSTIVTNSTNTDLNCVTLLMHDSDAKSTTVEALPKIIKYYKSKGYTFLPITRTSDAIHHNSED